MHLLGSNVIEFSANNWVNSVLKEVIILWTPTIKSLLLVTDLNLRPFGHIIRNKASVNQLHSLINSMNVTVNDSLTTFGICLASSILHLFNSLFKFDQRAHTELEVEQNENVVSASRKANLSGHLIRIDHIELGIAISQIFFHLIRQILFGILKHITF